MTKRNRVWGLRAQAVVVGALLSCGLVWNVRADTNERDENNFREDVIVCEEAVSHIAQCCTTIKPPSGACEFLHYEKIDSCGCSGGDSSSEHDDRSPVLSIGESRRVIDTECGAIDCSKMATMLARHHTSAGSHIGKCN